jgi:hypothetical protein
MPYPGGLNLPRKFTALDSDRTLPSSKLKALLVSRWSALLVVLPAFCLLWLDLFSLPLAPVGPALDFSWCGSLLHFSALGLQFGKDVIFTYGPLGYLTAFIYTGELFTARVTWEFASKTAFAAILCGTMMRLPRLWRPFFFFFVLFFIWADPISDALYFLVIVCLAAALFKEGRLGRSLSAFAGMFFAVCALIKFTYLLLAVFTLALVVIFYWQQRRRSLALIICSSFGLVFLLCWKLAGQDYANLFSYLSSSLEISFGYKEAMGIPAVNSFIVAAGVAAALLAGVQCCLLLFESRKLPVLCIVLFFIGETYLSWNRAFIRADDHVLSFFALCPVAMVTLWTTVQPRPLIRRIGHSTNFLIFAICLYGIFLQQPSVIANCITDTAARLTGTWKAVTALNATTRQLNSQLAEARAANALPRVRAEVGDRTIDVFGYEQGIALLNDLNYVPRPVLQGYSAYTPRLIAANTAFYSSANAPAYVLFKYQPIDERYPALDDAGVLRQLLYYYTPLFEEQGYSLWKRSEAPTPILPRLISTQALLFDEACPIPAGHNLWLEVDVQKSLRGRLLDLLYKPPRVEIWINDSHGRQIVHRLVPSMSSTGFIINPQLETSRDVLETAIGLHTGSVVSFLVHVPRESRRFFQRRVVCRLASLPELPAAALDRSSKQSRYRALLGDQDPQPDLIQAFDASTEVLLNLGPNRYEEFSSLNEVQLTIQENGLRIAATGSDPQVWLPKFLLGNAGQAILRIDLDAPADTGVQLFYLPAGLSTYGDHHMNRFVHRGSNTLYFLLTDAELAGGRLRLDPGMAPGDYVITHFEVRAVPANSNSLP